MFEMQMGSTHSLCDVLQQMINMYPEFVPTSFNAEPSPQTCNLEELEMAIEHFPNMWSLQEILNECSIQIVQDGYALKNEHESASSDAFFSHR